MPHMGVTVRYQGALTKALNMIIFGVYKECPTNRENGLIVGVSRILFR